MRFKNSWEKEHLDRLSNVNAKRLKNLWPLKLLKTKKPLKTKE